MTTDGCWACHCRSQIWYALDYRRNPGNKYSSLVHLLWIPAKIPVTREKVCYVISHMSALPLSRKSKIRNQPCSLTPSMCRHLASLQYERVWSVSTVVIITFLSATSLQCKIVCLSILSQISRSIALSYVTLSN